MSVGKGGGNTIVHVVIPPPMTEEAKEKILRGFYCNAWNAWNSIPVEERLRINAEWAAKEPNGYQPGVFDELSIGIIRESRYFNIFVEH